MAPASTSSPASTVPESQRCNLCGADDWQSHLPDVRDYLTGDVFDLFRCTSCGLIVTRPMPDGPAMDRYYPPRYRGNRHGFTAGLRVALRRRALQRAFPPGFRGRLLDVGCGDGAFALAMRAAGWTVCATEIDPATVTRLRQRGIDAKSPEEAERDGFGDPGQPHAFDAATSWHVMEHVEHPAQLAQWVRSQLKPEGVFRASVPNAICAQSRLFGRNWLHHDAPRHRFHFSPRTFRRLLVEAGFTIAGQQNFAFEYDWMSAIQSTLNALCEHSNGLFELLTSPPAERETTPLRDRLLTATLTAPLAVLSVPPLLLGWALRDGTSLTLECRA